jgi:glycosyltransferase involved in cell wall biosynthesis
MLPTLKNKASNSAIRPGKPIRVLNNIWSPFIFSHSTDYRAAHDLQHLSTQYDELKVVEVKSIFLILVNNLKFALTRALLPLMRRLTPRTLRELWHRTLRLSYLPNYYIRNSGADVILSHGSIPWPHQSYGVSRVIYHSLESDIYYSRSNRQGYQESEKRAKHWALRDADVVLTYHPGSRKRLENAIPHLQGRVFCLPPYIPDLEALNADRIIAKQAEPKIKMIFIGGQARRKGLINLLTAWERLPEDTRTKIEFTVVSDFKDGHIPSLRDQGIILLPLIPHSQILALLERSHVLVLPTLFDSFGRVLIEAMAMGCCVISSDQEPQDWILDQGKAGVLIDPESAESIGQAIHDVVSRPAERKALALQGVDRFLQEFHHRVVGAKLRQALDFAVSRNALR